MNFFKVALAVAVGVAFAPLITDAARQSSTRIQEAMKERRKAETPEGHSPRR